MTGLEAGSDIGGSIRNPAHFCGVYGHKPTYGIVPLQGHELVEGMPDADLAVCGPLARSAEDLHLALDVMAGPAEREAVGWNLVLPAPDFDSLGDLRVAVWPNDEQAPVSTEVADRAQQVAEILGRLGAKVSDTARPEIDLRLAHINYQMLLNSVMTMAMPDEEVAKAQEFVAGLEPGDWSDPAVVARASVLSHRDWLRSSYEREQLRRAWARFFDEWDILVCPQMPTAAFPHDHRPFGQRTLAVDGVEQPYFQQLFWAGVITNAYLPSTVFPTGLSRDGLPIGLQAVGGPYRDRHTVEFSRLITREIGGFTPPPGF